MVSSLSLMITGKLTLNRSLNLYNYIYYDINLLLKNILSRNLIFKNFNIY